MNKVTVDNIKLYYITLLVSPPHFCEIQPSYGREGSQAHKQQYKERLDPMPTSLVVDFIDVLLPIITKMINLSLESDLFADDWKCALVLPLLKKLVWARPSIQKLQTCQQLAVSFQS